MFFNLKSFLVLTGPSYYQGITYSLIMIQTTLGFTRPRRRDTAVPSLHQLHFAQNPDIPTQHADTMGNMDMEALDEANDDGFKFASSTRKSFAIEELRDGEAQPRKSALSHSRLDIV
jgi:hypothetical protein